jgi:type IV pilus assembly protein PilE
MIQSSEKGWIMNKKCKSIAGFTLIELMIVVSVIGILVGVAMPAYTNYVRKARAQEAPAELSKIRTRVEQYYQDNHSYTNIKTAGMCNPTDPKNFTYDCTGVDDTHYLLTATGNASENMADFYFDIDQDGNKTSIYFGSSSQPCWQTKKGGSC